MAELTAKGKSHIQQVDYIRAIASLVVALFHLGGKTLPVLNYGWLGVEMFFVLSGFIICFAIPVDYTWKLSGRFISKRIIRIEPPYIISIVLALIAHYLSVKNYQPDWTNVLLHFAYLNNFFGQSYLNPVYWTLGIEFQFYLFAALFFPFFIKRCGPYLLLVFCLVPLFFQMPGNTLFSFFPPFALGILYYLYYRNKVGIKEALLFGIAIFVCCVIKLGWAMSLAGLFALVLLVLPIKRNKIISFFSQISFSLYLTHDIIGSRLVVYMGTMLPKTFFYKGLEFISGIIISIAFAYFFYSCVEAPFLRYSKRIVYSKA